MKSIFYITLALNLILLASCWDTDELEIFDVVEEVNENFYLVLDIQQNAGLTDIKKAYRTLSKQLHPDKNDAPDAEIKFRQLVSIYEILRDDSRRAIYDRVLIEGLPDWRSPIYYYRRARKMSLIEISIILIVVISITQYLMAWGSYLDRRHTMEELLLKKYKIKDKKKKKPEDKENFLLFEEELNNLPKPSWWNILPIQLVKLMIFISLNGPRLIHTYIKAVKEEKLRREEEKRGQDEIERNLIEEEERKKEKRAMMKSRKRVQNLPDFSNDCLLDPVDGFEDYEQVSKPIRSVEYQEPVITGGPWTEDDFAELSRLMAKFPGGTSERWDKIATQMGRTVFEVTKMSNKVKGELMNRNTNLENEETVLEPKLKNKTKGGKHDLGENAEIDLGADELWSAIQQKALEKALKQFPKGTDQRWDKISRCVPEKRKEDCMLRFKYLAEKIRKKREDETKDVLDDYNCQLTNVDNVVTCNSQLKINNIAHDTKNEHMSVDS